MGTTLTGTTPQDTYDSLIKVTDNGPLSATAKYLSDGLGNDSKLALSTGSIGIGTATPAYNLHVNAASDSRIIITDSAQGSTANDGTYIRQSGVNSSIVNQENGTLQFGTNNSFAQTILANGNVGIGTSSPFYRLQSNTVSTSNTVSAGFVNTSTANNTTKGSSISLLLSDTVGNLKDAAYLRGFAGNANVTTGGLAIDVRKTDAEPTEIARFTADGLTFNGDTAAANALDDYEEGTWTMGVAFGGNSVGVTYGANTGKYTKIGRQVTATGYIELSSKGSSTGAATITGLPFTIPSGTSSFVPATLWLKTITFANQYQGYGAISDTSIVLGELTILGVFTALTDADFANSSEIMVSFTYFV